MNTIIDIYNKILFFNEDEINFLVDKNNIVWFKFANIASILEYKNRNNALIKHVDNKYKKSLKNIKLNYKLEKQQPDTVYITESGLYKLLIKSRMKKAEEFQEWLIEDALPKLREFGKYEVDSKIKKKLDKVTERMKILEEANKKLVKNMTKRKYPNGCHFYVLEDDGLYKIGYTKDLNKRLATYNTGRANRAEYAYYKKTDCAKQIEECMKALLNKYIYKTDKEFYKCSLKKILKEVKKCLDIEDKCYKCTDIKNHVDGNQQTGGTQRNNIMIELIYDSKEKYDKIIKYMYY